MGIFICPIAMYACPIPWDSHYIIIILIWNTIHLKFLIYDSLGLVSTK